MMNRIKQDVDQTNHNMLALSDHNQPECVSIRFGVEPWANAQRLILRSYTARQRAILSIM